MLSAQDEASCRALEHETLVKVVECVAYASGPRAYANGGTTIRAVGSENFPRGYQVLENAFYRMIRESQSSEGNS